MPERVDRWELAAFVLVPALPPLIFGGQLGSALATLLGNAVLLGLVYLVVGLGMFSIVAWAGRRLVDQLATSLELLGRAVPLLLVFALVLFVNTEMWQVFSNAPDAFLAIIGALFALIGATFLVLRLPREVAALEREISPERPLRRRERFNVGLVMFVSQAFQVLLVSLMIGAFLAVFGVLAIDDSLRAQWLGDPGNVLFHFNLFDERLELTSELLRVALGLAAFSGFYFSIAIFTDSTYREEFLDALTSEMRTSLEERAQYLKLRQNQTSD